MYHLNVSLKGCLKATLLSNWGYLDTIPYRPSSLLLVTEFTYASRQALYHQNLYSGQQLFLKLRDDAFFGANILKGFNQFTSDWGYNGAA